jgi:biopolymer transport protein ExbB
MHFGIMPAMWEIVRSGGPLMWPILLCSVIAIGIIVERLWTLKEDKVLPPGLTARILALIEAQQLGDKVVQALQQNSPLGRVFAAGIAHTGRPHTMVVERMQDTGRHVVLELDRFLNTLGTIAGVAPLLGLLGTVAGIIKSFNAITAVGLGDPRALSGGIAEALVCTAAGLSVAIPALIAFRYLRGRVDSLAVAIEKDAMLIADALDVRRHTAL